MRQSLRLSLLGRLVLCCKQIWPNTKMHLHTSSESITDSPRSGDEKTNNAGPTLGYSHLCYAWRRTEPQYPAGRPCGLVCMGSGEEVAEILHAMQSSVGTSAKCIATMRHCLTISWVAPARHQCYACHSPSIFQDCRESRQKRWFSSLEYQQK